MSRLKNPGKVRRNSKKGGVESLPGDLTSSVDLVVTKQKVNLDNTPDAAVGGVLESRIEQNENDEYEKINTLATLPKTISGEKYTEEYGGGRVLVTRTFGETVPEQTNGGLTVLKQESLPLRDGLYQTDKEQKATDSWPTLSGQQFDNRTGVVTQFTETHNTPGQNIGDANTEITPITDKIQRKRVWTPPTAALAALVHSFPGTVDLQFPDVLKSVTVTFNSSSGNASSNHPVSQQFFLSVGESGGGSLSPNSSATGSAMIMPDINPEIEQVWARDIPVTHYVFYLPANFTASDVLAKLQTITGQTVNPWPVFRPVSHTFTLIGKQLSLTVSADTRVASSFNDGGAGYTKTYEFGSSQNRQVGGTVRSVRLPPTIHGAINLTGATQSASVSVDVDANTTPVFMNGSEFIEGIENDPPIVTEEIEGSVSPSSLSATTGATAIPSSGLYLHGRIDSNLYEWGYYQVHAVVVDFANLS